MRVAVLWLEERMGFTQMRETDQSLSFAVVDAVATHEGVSVADLPPLGNAIDPDALDDLFEPKFDGSLRQGGEVTFDYCGYTVVVDASGRVDIGR